MRVRLDVQPTTPCLELCERQLLAWDEAVCFVRFVHPLQQLLLCSVAYRCSPACKCCSRGTEHAFSPAMQEKVSAAVAVCSGSCAKQWHGTCGCVHFIMLVPESLYKLMCYSTAGPSCVQRTGAVSAFGFRMCMMRIHALMDALIVCAAAPSGPWYGLPMLSP